MIKVGINATYEDIILLQEDMQANIIYLNIEKIKDEYKVENVT